MLDEAFGCTDYTVSWRLIHWLSLSGLLVILPDVLQEAGPSNAHRHCALTWQGFETEKW
jgi:hypothetical protein